MRYSLLLTSILLFLIPLNVRGQGVSKENNDIANNKFKKREVRMQGKVENFSRLFELSNLRTSQLNKDEYEIRIWTGFGLQELDCFVMKKSGGKRAAYYISRKFDNEQLVLEKLSLTSPFGGWEKFEDYLDKNNINIDLNLSLDTEYISDPDQQYIFIEVRSGTAYKFIWYPSTSNHIDGKKVIAACSNTNKEFDITLSCG